MVDDRPEACPHHLVTESHSSKRVGNRLPVVGFLLVLFIRYNHHRTEYVILY